MGAETDRTKTDMLHGSLWNKIPRYALPVAATAILEQLFNASDIAVVGNFAVANRTAAVAAVGANSPIIGLILNLFIGIALGANVVIANAIGKNDKDTVHRAVHTSVVLALMGGVLVAVIGEVIAAKLLGVLHVPDDVFPLAVAYLRIYLLGMPVIFLYNFEAAIFRSIGDTKSPLKALAVSGVLNVIFNLFFVIVLKMTVEGVAIATVLANIISSAILFRKLIKSDQAIRLEVKALRLDRNSLERIIRIGLPAGIQSAVFAIANIVIQSAINSLGTVVMAASSAAFNIECLVYDVLNSFGQACTTFVGQNFGAGQLKRCRKTLALCLAEGTLASAASVVLVLFSGKFLLSIFTDQPEVIALGYTRLVMIFTAYAFSMLYEVMSGYLRGFGISFVPAVLTTIGVCVVRIVWIHTVFPMSRTFQTILTAYPVSLATTAVLILIALLCYRPSRRFEAEMFGKNGEGMKETKGMRVAKIRKLQEKIRKPSGCTKNDLP